MPQAKTIALVDVGCLFKRTFEANPNAGGQNTLAEIVRIEERVEHVVLCLDSPPYAKKEIFPEYKAQRPEPETSEVFQKRWLYEELKRRGYPMARVKGQEADDVIATLARIYGESWAEVWLVGADKDLAQCVTDNVLQLVPKHGDRAEHFRGPADVKEKFEVTPKQIPLFLALWGDKSDNVPGVPGIGPVKAAGLIAEHKTLTGIAEHLAAGSGKVWEALRANWEQLVLSLKLTTLDTKLPLDAEALLVRAEPKVAETMAPQVELAFDGFMGNATPMPEPPSLALQIAAENAKLNVLMNETPEPEPNADEVWAAQAGGQGAMGPAAVPQPLIGKDPRADEFLRQEAAARAAHAEEQKREEQWRQQRRAEQQQASEAHAAPKSAPSPKVTEAEFIPFGQPGPVPAPKPQPAAPPAAERADRPGLAKTTPEYGMVTSKLEPEDLRSAEVIAKWLDAGGLYKAKFKTPAAIVTVIMYGKALGLPMMAALSGFHIIEGKPSASADLIRALAMRSPKCKYFRLVSADDTQATWETWHRDHDEPSRLTYTIDEARKAGLRGGNWNSREKQMLVKTCSTVLARWVYTIETMGLYCPEEMGDYVDTVGEAA